MNKKKVAMFLAFVAFMAIGGIGIKLWKDYKQSEVDNQAKYAPVGDGVLGKMSPEREEAPPEENITSEWVKNDDFEYFRPPPREEKRKRSEQRRRSQPEAKKESKGMPALVHAGGSKKIEQPRFSGYEFPSRFAPFGTLIPCTLVTTVESNNQQTPLIALVSRDVYQNGKLIIPAGTYAHYNGGSTRIRDRVFISGTWVFIWENGKEYRITGTALDREKNPDGEGYAMTDGSAGLRGRKLKTDDYAELKIMLAAALSGFAEGTQERRSTSTGDVITEGSIENGAKEGVSELMERYIEIIEDQMEAEWFYVQVPAGKEFYIYPTQTVEPDLRSYGGLEQGGEARTSYQIAAAKHQMAKQAYQEQMNLLADANQKSSEDEKKRALEVKRQARLQEIREALRRGKQNQVQ